MIYMAGDNNLSYDMVYSLKEIKEAIGQQNDSLNLLVYYDGSSLNTPTLYCDFTEFKNPFYIPAFQVEKRYVHRRKKTAVFENENAAAMYSLMNFVDWCVNDEKRSRKADNYILIVSGHGFGFQNISFLKDDRSDYYMTIPRFRKALKFIKEEVLEKPVEILGFDNCVMSMLEIGNELAESANIMIASEGSIPNAGWTYGNILGKLIENSRPENNKILAEDFVRCFIECQKEYAIGGVSVDMSAWDLSKVKTVAAAVNSLGEILYQGLKNTDIRSPLELVLLKAHFKAQSYMFEQNVDLKDFCQILSETSGFLSEGDKVTLTGGEFEFKTELVNRCQAVMAAVDECVIISGFSGGTYQYSNGISIFFPWTYLTYTLSGNSYSKLAFAKSDGTYWDSFLKLYLGAISLRQPKETINETIIFAPATQNKIAENPANKIADNPANKIVENAANKIAENAANKIAENPANKIAENPANKLLGVLGLTFVDFKNVAAPWYITGYTKEESKEAKTGV